MSSYLKTIVLAISIVAAGCQDSPHSDASASTPQQHVPAPAVFMVFGADRTGSYDDMTQLALRIGQTILAKAEAGDQLIYRWISDRSYEVDQVFLHLRMPAAPSAPTNGNPFDTRFKATRAILAKKVKQLKMKGIARLQQERPGPTKSTDIYGFVAAAAEDFESAPQGTVRKLVLATDLDDNRGYDVQPDLKGVEVVVYPVKNVADPAMMQAKRVRWEEFFKRCGAVSVSFHAAYATQ